MLPTLLRLLALEVGIPEEKYRTEARGMACTCLPLEQVINASVNHFFFTNDNLLFIFTVRREHFRVNANMYTHAKFFVQTIRKIRNYIRLLVIGNLLNIQMYIKTSLCNILFRQLSQFKGW